MIIPFLRGFGSFRTAPVTWMIIIMNCFILMITLNSIGTTQDRLEDLAKDEEFTQIQGRLFAGYILEKPARFPASYQKMAEEALVDSDEDQISFLGTLAMRDNNFYNEAVSVQTGTDIVERKWWASKSKEILAVREAHPGYSLGVTEKDASIEKWFTYQFIHSDEMHLFVNMLVFAVFGAALEPLIGGAALLVVFLISGVGAALMYLMIDEVTAIPLIGASGAVSGIVTMFCVLNWNRGLKHFYFLFVPKRGYSGFVYIPAWLALILWMAADLAGFVATPQELGGVAHSAHMGGEVSGIICALVMLGYLKFMDKKLPAEALIAVTGPNLKAEPL